jgi:hypothetical protein
MLLKVSIETKRNETKQVTGCPQNVNTVPKFATDLDTRGDLVGNELGCIRALDGWQERPQ